MQNNCKIIWEMFCRMENGNYICRNKNEIDMKAQVLNQLIKNGNSVEESIKMANSYLLEQAIKAGHKTAKKIAMYIVRFYN